MTENERAILFYIYEKTKHCPYTRTERATGTSGYAPYTAKLEEIVAATQLSQVKVAEILGGLHFPQQEAVLYKMGTDEKYCLTVRGIQIVEREQDRAWQDHLQKRQFKFSIIGVVVGAILGAGLTLLANWLLKDGK